MEREKKILRFRRIREVVPQKAVANSIRYAAMDEVLVSCVPEVIGEFSADVEEFATRAALKLGMFADNFGNSPSDADDIKNIMFADIAAYSVTKRDLWKNTPGIRLVNNEFIKRDEHFKRMIRITKEAARREKAFMEQEL